MSEKEELNEEEFKEAIEEGDENNFELGEPEEGSSFEEGGELQDPFEDE
ncbi:hypothetical protein PN417_09935 [Halorubrum ezzemoulense]|nr:hypothetical protein [Halorubrum ezzemoulense]MDB9301254.1 hypothetical protein [Halorubrum ezzemoulense]